MSTLNRLGLDLSGDHFDLYLVGPDGRPLAPHRRFAHDALGSRAALDYVQAACARAPADHLLIGGEATGLLWWHLFHQWAIDPSLADSHPIFYLLNPHLVKSFRTATSVRDKTDRLDAQLIARYLGVPELLPEPWVDQHAYWPLRFLTRFRCRLAHTLGALKSYAYPWLYLKASAYTLVQPFADLFSKTSLTLLQTYPTLDALAELKAEALAEQLDVWGKRRFADPLANAHKLHEVAQRSYPLDAETAQAVHFILGQVIDLIGFHQKGLDSLNAFIAAQVAEDADIHNLQTIGGIGPVYAAGLAAELRPTERFLSGTKLDVRRGIERARTLDDAQAAVAKLAGLWWPRRQSGQVEAQDRPLSKAGNAYLRYYLVEAANCVRGNVAEYGDYYARKYAEATRHHHHRALVLTARKLARLVFVLLHKHETYQPRQVPAR